MPMVNEMRDNDVGGFDNAPDQNSQTVLRQFCDFGKGYETCV